ncbi:MAG TPA: ABC transporter ATP-binding protein [Gammaproteobacteria bacterium]|jgi:ABC-2 type transport system ATP-binding protein|nr:ABC transporter ATP-binding protein [Gammaproteobacteria bacterium]
MTTSVLEISDLTKRYGKLTALAGLNLTLHDGTVHGLVGPNGAGKTTMLSVISGLRRKTSGEIIFGVPTNKVMLMPDTPDFFPFLTAREIVDLARYPFRKEVSEESVTEVIELVGLGDSIDRRVGGFSRGMKQRLGLATTLIGEPQLLLLDEPCSALDPIGRREILDVILRLKSKSTVLFSTHLLSDVEAVCDSVTVVDHGKTLYEGTVSGIRKSKNQSFEDAVLELLQPGRSAG